MSRLIGWAAALWALWFAYRERMLTRLIARDGVFLGTIKFIYDEKRIEEQLYDDHALHADTLRVWQWATPSAGSGGTSSSGAWRTTHIAALAGALAPLATSATRRRQTAKTSRGPFG